MGAVKNPPSIFTDIIQIEVDPPPFPRIFDKNHEILGFETYILYYP